MRVILLNELFSIIRLDPKQSFLPDATGGFVSITYTQDELSIVVQTDRAPEGGVRTTDWRCLQLEGPLNLALTGILVSVLTPLGNARIPVFSVATYNTDYVLIRDKDLDRAIAALELDGHSVIAIHTESEETG